MRNLTKLLVANRGEIACRVFRTARRMGLRTVAVYSEADADALHVRQADEAFALAGSLASETYLSIPSLLEAARRTRADAVHPGYGFLSENADFAQACFDAGLVFVGPKSDAMLALGNKSRAKELAHRVGVSCLAGYQGDRQDDRTLAQEAARIGYPLLIKAAAGGGGRGMRRVDRAEDLAGALASARTEAKNAFGSGQLLLEQLAQRARHVEIQILADEHGHYVALGERDCSVQRRHQKVIEESPCPVLSAEQRREMSSAARTLAMAAGYTNAGTVEFLLDERGRFYFLEMNTRLQVEHPVTEQVTGFDLVELQLRVARGESLAHLPLDVPLQGHSIEARLYAEDPSQGFMPQTGKIERWIVPSSPSVRVDRGVAEGSLVTSFYDPLVAKVIATGRDRSEAIGSLLSGLADTVLLGVRTNGEFLQRILQHETFQQGEATTSFLDESGLLDREESAEDRRLAALAGVIFIEEASRSQPSGLKGWRSTGSVITPIRLQSTAGVFDLSILYEKNRYEVSIGETKSVMQVIESSPGVIAWTEDDVRRSARFMIVDDRLSVACNGMTRSFDDVTYAPPIDAQSSSGGVVRSPTSGRVLRVTGSSGKLVRKGDLLAVIEAMKMENHVVALRDGEIDAVHIVEGQQVEANQILVTLVELTPQ